LYGRIGTHISEILAFLDGLEREEAFPEEVNDEMETLPSSTVDYGDCAGDVPVRYFVMTSEDDDRVARDWARFVAGPDWEVHFRALAVFEDNIFWLISHHSENNLIVLLRSIQSKVTAYHTRLIKRFVDETDDIIVSGTHSKGKLYRRAARLSDESLTETAFQLKKALPIAQAPHDPDRVPRICQQCGAGDNIYYTAPKLDDQGLADFEP
jgi:hypothetical protein